MKNKIHDREKKCRLDGFADLGALGAKSGLPLRLRVVLQLEPLCDPVSSSWREAGCVALRARFSAAAVERKTTLPALITTGIAAMRAKGVEAPLLDAAQGKVGSGDIKGAAILYDAAVRTSEGT